MGVYTYVFLCGKTILLVLVTVRRKDLKPPKTGLHRNVLVKDLYMHSKLYGT